MSMSLHRRLLVSAAVVLVFFLCLTGLSLDRAFQKSAKSAVYERLQGQLYAALGVAEMDKQGHLYLAKPLPDPHFHSVDSSLYAEFYHVDQSQRWQSLSLLDTEILYETTPEQGKYEFGQAKTLDGKLVFVLSFGTAWRDYDNQLQEFIFHISEDQKIYEQQVIEFRYNLWGWLAGSTLFLLLTQAVVLRWGLRPLRKVAEEIKTIENQDKDSLSGNYPSELKALTDNINALISANRMQLGRYRNALDDLAHSLKTPLAILQVYLEKEGQPSNKNTGMVDQIRRMSDIVQYHLQRASTAGSHHWLRSVNVSTLINKTVNAMKKVYREKGLSYGLDIEDEIKFSADESDLMEVIGNLLDNACKWAKSRVTIRARNLASDNSVKNSPEKLVITIEDDGPGFPPDQIEELLKRGARADQMIDGQGIGLALVGEIIELYKGELRISNSSLGGARIEVSLPHKVKKN